MSEGYAKLFSDIVDSSIWNECSDICKVWVTMLALADMNGYLRGSPGWLAAKSRVPISVCESALKKFESPDPSSRTPDNDGKRIESLEDGWLILNYIQFRERLSTNPKTVATRLRVQKHRERYKALRNEKSVTSDHSASASVSVGVQGKEKVQEENRERGPFTSEHHPSLETIKLAANKAGLPEIEASKFFNHYSTNGWKVGKNQMRSLSHAIANWKIRYDEGRAKTYKPNYPKRADRNAGTANERNPTRYSDDLPEKLQAARLRDAERSKSGSSETSGQ